MAALSPVGFLSARLAAPHAGRTEHERAVLSAGRIRLRRDDQPRLRGAREGDDSAQRVGVVAANEHDARRRGRRRELRPHVEQPAIEPARDLQRRHEKRRRSQQAERCGFEEAIAKVTNPIHGGPTPAVGEYATRT